MNLKKFFINYICSISMNWTSDKFVERPYLPKFCHLIINKKERKKNFFDPFNHPWNHVKWKSLKGNEI